MTSQRKLLLKAAFTQGRQALDYWNEWRKRGDIDVLGDGSYAALPILFRNLEGHGLPASDLNRLKGVYRFHWCQNQLLLQGLTDLVRCLGRIDVDIVLLKGAALLFRADHEQFLRPIGELDVLVPRNRVRQALALLGREGWTPQLAPRCIDPAFLRATPYIALEHAGGTRCNLNWAPFHEATWEGAERPFWDHASMVSEQGVSAMVLAPTEQLLHVCLHGRYYGASPPVSCLADALLLLRRESAAIDWMRLLDLANIYQGTVHLRETLVYLREEFSAPVSPQIIEELMQRPISRFERLQQDLATQSGGHRRIKRALLRHWLAHSRSLPGKGSIYRMAQFPRYLRHTWNLRPR